jgi:hypothetical protein
VAWQFHKHYTREEARSLLPEIRRWLTRCAALHTEVERLEVRLRKLMGPGRDVGGDAVNKWVRQLAAFEQVLLEFQRREIQIKDLRRGLIDFPAILEGREVFLCWEQDEEDIEFWHELDAGYAGRERL